MSTEVKIKITGDAGGAKAAARDAEKALQGVQAESQDTAKALGGVEGAAVKAAVSSGDAIKTAANTADLSAKKFVSMVSGVFNKVTDAVAPGLEALGMSAQAVEGMSSVAKETAQFANQLSPLGPAAMMIGGGITAIMGAVDKFASHSAQKAAELEKEIITGAERGAQLGMRLLKEIRDDEAKTKSQESAAKTMREAAMKMRSNRDLTVGDIEAVAVYDPERAREMMTYAKSRNNWRIPEGFQTLNDALFIEQRLAARTPEQWDLARAGLEATRGEGWWGRVGNQRLADVLPEGMMPRDLRKDMALLSRIEAAVQAYPTMVGQERSTWTHDAKTAMYGENPTPLQGWFDTKTMDAQGRELVDELRKSNANLERILQKLPSGGLL